MRLICTRESFGSNSGGDTKYPDKPDAFFLFLSQSLQINAGIVIIATSF
jgi:hypothetical protein